MDNLDDIVLTAYLYVEPPESDVVSVDLDGNFGNFSEMILVG